MNRDRLRKVSEVFRVACATPVERRDPLIAELSQGDAELVAEVQELLRIDQSIPEYLEEEQLAGKAAERMLEVMTPGPGEAFEHPTRIGAYEILDVLGEGGMGVVYRARQREPVEREVALKVIRPGMDSRLVLARFRAERQALARMDHPGIARVFDGGLTPSEQGSRPYFVMELAQGVPITRYCDEHRLLLRDRVKLLWQACEAVQHAHQRGIIHRDLKPSNLLVVEPLPGRPQVKVIDFGVAKAVSDEVPGQTLISVAGQLVGTPEYMSPEQAALGDRDVDTRADVYALGVMLYELLCGQLPFDPERLRSTGFLGVQRILRDEVPPTPSTRLRSADLGTPAPVAEAAGRRSRSRTALVRELRGDLDWITMKCLEKDRERRYRSPEALADDLRRFLVRRPVEAGPPSLAYRAQKFVRRNRLAVVAATLVLAALVAGVAGIATGLRTALRARDEATARAADLEAVSQYQQRMLRDIDVEEMGRAILAAVRSVVQGRIDEEQLAALDRHLQQVNHSDLSRQVLGETILAWAEEAVEEQFADRPRLAATLLNSIGVTSYRLGMADSSERAFRRVLELGDATLGWEDPDALAAAADLSFVHAQSGRLEQALELIDPTVDRARRVLGEDHIVTLRARMFQAYTDLQTKQYEQAEARYLSTIERMKRVLGEGHEATLEAVNQLSILYLETSRQVQAAELGRVVLEGRRALYGEDGVKTISARNNLAVALMRFGRLDEALPYTAANLDSYMRTLGEKHWLTAIAENSLGYALVRTGRYEEAEPHLRRALQGLEARLGPEHQHSWTTRCNLGELLLRRGQVEEAEPLLRRCFVHYRTSGDPLPVVQHSQRLLAGALAGMQRIDEALELFEDERARREAEWEPGRLMHVVAAVQLVYAYTAIGWFDEAETAFLDAWDLRSVEPENNIFDELRRAAVALYDAWESAAPGEGYGAQALELEAEAMEPAAAGATEPP